MDSSRAQDLFFQKDQIQRKEGTGYICIPLGIETTKALQQRQRWRMEGLRACLSLTWKVRPPTS